VKNSMFIKSGSLFFFIFIAISLLSNCSKNSTEPDRFNFPDSNLSFSRHIRPIFEENCTSSGCHAMVNPAAGLDLETPAPTFMSNDGPVVFPFDAEHSILYLIIDVGYNGIRMPLNGNYLDKEQIQAIKTWINEGAIINK
jgi:hypothetical protein